MTHFEDNTNIQTTIRSYQVDDIIKKMPTRFSKINTMLIIAILFLLLLFGWLIKYPDTISGKIIITTSNAPIKLTAYASGKINFLININESNYVHEDGNIAVIENTANTNDVIKTHLFLKNKKSRLSDIMFILKNLSDSLNLGEVSLTFNQFYKQLILLKTFKQNNSILYKITLYENQNRHSNIILKQQLTEQKIKTYNIDIYNKQLYRDSVLKLSGIISTSDYEHSILNHRQAEIQQININKEIENNKQGISSTRDNIMLLKAEYKEKEDEILANLIASFDELMSQFNAWEKKYIIKSPISGIIEVIGFINNNTFVTTGQEIVAVIPKEKKMKGEMLLPTVGAGKVKINDEIIIKLDNYPFTEFGSIKGKVLNISRISKQKTPQELTQPSTSLNDYLVQVIISDSLITNYGFKIDSDKELRGIGEIVVNKRRLIHRFFDNLNYLTRE